MSRAAERRRREEDDDAFCGACGVVLELHPWPEDDRDPGCEVAGMKADVLRDFGWRG